MTCKISKIVALTCFHWLWGNQTWLFFNPFKCFLHLKFGGSIIHGLVKSVKLRPGDPRDGNKTTPSELPRRNVVQYADAVGILRKWFENTKSGIVQIRLESFLLLS